MAKRTEFVDRPALVDGLSTVNLPRGGVGLRVSGLKRQTCKVQDHSPHLTPDGDYGLEPCRFAF